MKRFAVLVAVLLIALALVEAAPKEPKPPKVLPPRIVRCNDKHYPSCFHNEFTCPAACSRNCTANCITCQPTCGPPPPKQKLVKCKDHKTYNACSKIQQLCPLSCARTCTVDCKTCQPVCDPVSPVYSPPPPPYTPPTPTLSPPPTPYTPPPPPPPSPTPYTPPPPPPPYTPPTPTLSPPSTPYTPPPTVTPSTPPSSAPPTPYTPAPTVTPSTPPSSPPPTPYTPPPTVTPSPPPSSGVSPKHFARCMNKNYTQCYQRKLTCPPTCSESCHVDCVTCSPVCSCDQPGTVCQDPKFIGADGLTFYFHGKKEQDFCLITDSNLHINAHFIGKRNTDMGRDFTWVQSLGILFDNHQLYLGAKKTATWNDALDHLSLSFDGQPINLNEADGATWHSSNGLTITRSKATNAVEIEAENKFKIKAVVVPITEKESMIHKYGITQEDCFAHLDLSFKFYSLSGDVNGVLGQTYASNYVSRVKMGIEMPVLGGEKEFHSSGLFTTDCAVNKFIGEGIDEEFSQAMEFADLNCASGINGRGVVCKKR